MTKTFIVQIELEVTAKDKSEALIYALEDITELSKDGTLDATITEVPEPQGVNTFVQQSLALIPDSAWDITPADLIPDDELPF